MHWEKLGIIYRPNGDTWKNSHAMVPTPYELNDNIIRIFITHRDEQGIGRVGFIDVQSTNPKKVINQSEKPVLNIGEKGMCDESGVIACSVVEVDPNTIYMYYVGFELGKQIRYRLLTGVAISNDGGESFRRYSKTPILERSDIEPYFRGGPFCIKDNTNYRMWYCGGSTWLDIDGKNMPEYNIKYVESNDGVNWPSHGVTQINVEYDSEYGFGRPAVIYYENNYLMFYSIRDLNSKEYRLGLAKSDDGKKWLRCDDELNLNISENFYETKAIMYASPFVIKDQLYVFYNGNDFGKDGVALARLVQ